MTLAVVEPATQGGGIPIVGRRARARSARGRLAALLAGALAPLAAVAQVEVPALSQLSVEQLKALYLACDRASLDGRLDRTDILRCSIVYEDLKRRAFGGDFDKLLAWSRRTPSRPANASLGK